MKPRKGPPKVGAVVIGRNEGARLVACLAALAARDLVKVVYVDSGSTDGSTDAATQRGAAVVHLDTTRGFTAARARNAGLRELRRLVPDVAHVLFVDGDCTLEDGFLELAVRKLEQEAQLAAVCGRRRERFPDASVFNRLCDMEWDTPIGTAEACGGDALMRVHALVEAGGFDDDFIAGEEPELCPRLRRRGWRIERVDAPMTVHDADLHRFGAWWKRMKRGGYAAAANVDRHGVGGVRHMTAIVKSAVLHAGLVPAALLTLSALLVWRGSSAAFAVPFVAALFYTRQYLRIARGRRARGALPEHAALYARYVLIAKFAELLGIVRQWYGRLFGRPAGIIEYKRAAAALTNDMATDSRATRVAYLVNQYPKTSHAWMRREIEGVVAAGVEVDRYSIRRVDEPLVDPGDQRELAATTFLLEQGAKRIVWSTLLVALAHPRLFARAIALTWSISTRHPRGRFFHFVYLAEACLLVRLLERRPAAHLHAHFGTNSATVALLAHTLGGPPFSFTFHGPEIFESISPRCLRAKIHAARFVVAISHHGFSALERWSDPSHWHKLRLVRCGTDESFLGTAPTPLPKEQRIVCVARLSPVKGHLVLLDALAELVKEGFDPQLSLVGDGEFRQVVERHAERLGLAARIRWCGWLGGEGVRREVLAARLMVLPSFDEGLPVVFMESLALHRPVVSTYIAGIPELIQNGSTGWVVPAGSVDHLVDALREALTLGDEALMDIARNGARAVKERHDSAREAARLAALFEETRRAA